MYDGIPYESYNQICEAIKKRNAVLRIAKGGSSQLLIRFGQNSMLVLLAFFLPFFLPLAFLIGWYFYIGDILVLLAVPVYVIFPFVLPNRRLIAMGMTALGLFGLVWNWPAPLTALLIPGILSYLGSWLWQQSLLMTVCREILNKKEAFEELWTQQFIAIQDKDGIYTYSKKIKG